MADGGTAVDPGGSGVAVSGTQQNRGGRRRGPRRGGANNQTPVETAGVEQLPIARGTGRRGRGGQRQNQPNQANDGPAQSQGDTQMENQNPVRGSARRGRGGRQAGKNPQAQGQQPVSESESANRGERGGRGNQTRPANRGNRGAGPGRVYIPRPPPLFDEFERGEHVFQQDFTIGPLNPNSSRGRRGSFFQGNWHQGQMVQQRNGPNPFHFDPGAPEFVPGQPMRGPKTPKHNKPRKYPPRERAASPEIPDAPNQDQREKLIYQLQQESLDCTICLNKVRKRDRIWSCSTCYNIFHLPCMRTWGNSTETTMWKCPLCQLDCPPNPPYKCFCGKEKNPEFSRGEIPHSCGKPCQKVKGVNCPHLCTEPCHPGPCPECPATVLKPCLCGKKRIPVRCGAKSALRMCALICEKPLPCGKHKCARPCHDGACDDCEQEEEKVCCCGKETKMVRCGTTFSCEQVCGGMHSCGLHTCVQICHPPVIGAEVGKTCGPCPQSNEKLKTCPCSQTPLEKLGRTKCDEPVPTCGKTCNKQLFCGSGEHRCQSACHQGPCPPCPLSTSVPCRCGRSRQEVDCVEFNSNFELYSTLECDNICPKKLMCGKHVCQKKCCPLDMHICEKVCQKKLTCCKHTCSMLCHRGPCLPCTVVSFDDLHCRCGVTVLPAPIRCGRGVLPPCDAICTRHHPCGHYPNHTCHEEAECPPCIELVSKECAGGHRLLRNIRCHLEDNTCGLICDKPLPCGAHSCIRKCHGGDCVSPGRCQRSCNKPRSTCEHDCGLPCHGKTDCPPSVCNKPVEVICPCGRQKEKLPCDLVSKNLERRAALRQLDAEEGGSQALPPRLYRSASMDRLTSLDCDGECERLSRIRGMAEGLEIEVDAEGNQVSIPCIVYPEFLRDAMRIEGPFVVAVEETFKKLIESVDRLGYEQSHNFPPMHAHRRRIIHEYARLYKICTESVDREPKRSVIATARKDAAAPRVTLSAFAQRFPAELKKTGPLTICKRKLEKFFEIAAAQPPVPLEPGLQAVGSTKKAFRRQAPQPVFAAPQPTLISNRFAAMALFDDDYGAETRQAQQPPKIDSPSTSTESEAPAEQPPAEPEEEDDDPSTWEDL